MTKSTRDHISFKTPIELLYGDKDYSAEIQKDINLTYACLLLERRQYHLAVNYLRSGKKLPEGEHENIWFLLKVQLLCGIEDYAQSKKLLLERMKANGEDNMLFSALQYVIWEEFIKSGSGGPAAEPSEKKKKAVLQPPVTTSELEEYLSECSREITEALVLWKDGDEPTDRILTWQKTNGKVTPICKAILKTGFSSQLNLEFLAFWTSSRYPSKAASAAETRIPIIIGLDFTKKMEVTITTKVKTIPPPLAEGLISNIPGCLCLVGSVTSPTSLNLFINQGAEKYEIRKAKDAGINI